MHCPETEGARHKAHDSIADPQIDAITAASDEVWVQWHRPVTWKIPTLLAKTKHPPRTAVDRQRTQQEYPMTPMGHAYWARTVAHTACPEDIVRFTPDGLLWDRINNRGVRILQVYGHQSRGHGGQTHPESAGLPRVATLPPAVASGPYDRAPHLCHGHHRLHTRAEVDKDV
eukprot:2138353-Rhodomonas_salina.1